MKRLIYVIPILLTIIFTSNVYGYELAPGTTIKFNCEDVADALQYLNDNYSIPSTQINTITDYSDLTNYTVYNEACQTYKYNCILGNKVIFYDEIFDLDIFVTDNRITTGNYTVINIKPNIIGNIKYFNINTQTLNEVTLTESSSIVTAQYFFKSNQYYTEEHILSEIISNFDIKWMSGLSVIEKEPTVDVICEYNSDYSQATLTANVLNAQGGEKLYYSGDIIFNSGLNSGSSEGQHSGAGSSFGEEADSLFHLYSAPVSFTTNRVVTFKLCDSNDNFICQTSYNITQIQNFNGVSFDVSFDTSNASYLIFTPTLDSLNNAYYSIYCRINADTDDLLVTRNGNRFSDYSDTNYTLLSNNETITLKYTGLFSANVNIDFEIRNKNNGEVVLSRTYSYKISRLSDSSLNDIVENGTSTGGGLGSGFSSLNENSSINDIINTSKESFNTFSSIFDLLPGFIWAFIGTILVVLIVLRVLGR